MRFIATAALIAALASGAIAADLKVGVVDMNKAFAEYYKTKDAASKMKGNQEKARSEINEKYASYKTLLGDTQKKMKEAQDPILTEAARGKARAEYESNVKNVRELEQEINEFQQRRSMQLKQEEVQLQKGLYEEIVALVKDKAKTSAFDFVFDKSGISLNSTPVLLYYKDATDITDEVIVQLNKDAPADAGKAADDKKEEKKEEKPKTSGKKSK